MWKCFTYRYDMGDYGEVRKINTTFLSVSHIFTENPIMRDKAETKQLYLKRLSSYLRAGHWSRRKTVKATLKAYETIISSSQESSETHTIEHYQHYLLLDVIHILWYEIASVKRDSIDNLKKKYDIDFKDSCDNGLFERIIDAFDGENREQKILSLMNDSALKGESHYLDLMLKNIRFMETKPASVMVTATMSAGKSTFINSLTGKYVCLSQNMACTSKIHVIMNKAFEDGYSYEYDHDLVMTAGREELLNDNELNTSDRIYVGTHFSGLLADTRIVISDSPGVNFSENHDHKLIAEKLIRRRQYKLIIYVMNATQLGTNDEDAHLDYVKRRIGRTPVLFIINKIDAFNVDEEDLDAALARQVDYLKKKGFRNPAVCPISARAGFLSKCFVESALSRTDTRELYSYVDKFDQMGLPRYYESRFDGIQIDDAEEEEIQLQKTSGLAYVERLILSTIKGR